ncbi:MAG: cytochrome c, testis [Magnetococcales bacterium]|nr:cytochrome c, testis [Magnetococcales bacterium]HIJ84371.1 hypothetical protein [Magnetococcales bacterium]
MKGWRSIVCALVISGWLSACDDSPEPGNGAKIAEIHCAPCHDLTPAATIRHAPPLWGIYKRPLGQIVDFTYSPSVAGRVKRGDFVWDDANLDLFLKNPQELFPNNRMSAWDPGMPSAHSSPDHGKDLEATRAVLASTGHYEPFTGFENDFDRMDLLAFLKTLGHRARQEK